MSFTNTECAEYAEVTYVSNLGSFHAICKKEINLL